MTRHTMACSRNILPPSLTFPTAPRFRFFSRSLKAFSGVCSFEAKRHKLDSFHKCSAVSKPHDQDLFRNGLPLTKWNEFVDDDIERGAPQVSALKEIGKRVEAIKLMLSSMDDGEISVSAYDTAWVALVEDINGSGTPQFPSSLDWIANNQLSDGSWGDSGIFSAHDRIINTLACVVALKSWNIHPENCEKGMLFLRENMYKLGNENLEQMPIGFEVAFPSLLEIARSLDIQVPYDAPSLQEIYTRRNIKLTRIPRELLHNVPTTLLHSLEGMAGLDWEKLLNLQCQDGSFLFSPSSTAFALMQTKNKYCLGYLQKAIQRFDGGVPNVYPVDLFEHIWAMDRLERLGISRYFQTEIRDCLNYIYRYWTEKGICWARNSWVNDIDDTAMGFRLLRLHGYKVSADVFQNFKRDSEFFCFAGQSTQAVTGMFNLLRASQVQFPGEDILEDARQFSSKFLKEKQAANELLDKWIIAKDLVGEVRYMLEVPWYASLPRVETRFYIEQYGGEDDAWIGKTIYRMPKVSNNVYLELAKLDYNNCQALYQMEWSILQQWYEACNVGRFKISRRRLLFAYFLAASNLYEPEKSRQRLGWAKTAALIEIIAYYFDRQGISIEDRIAFFHYFKNCANIKDYRNARKSEINKLGQELVVTLLGTVNVLSLETLVAHGHDIRHRLCDAWKKWLQSADRYDSGEAELLVQTIILTSGNWVPEEAFAHPQYQRLSTLTNHVCSQLRQYRAWKVKYSGSNTPDAHRISLHEIELRMQELVREVLENSSDGINLSIKQAFLMVAKSFYYSAYCDTRTIACHMAKVLFERVE